MIRKRSLMVCLGLTSAMACVAAQADPSQDKTITDQVQSAFTSHADVGTEVSVMTKDGVVYLKGHSSTPLAKAHAEGLARAVPGVQKVVNDIGTEK